MKWWPIWLTIQLKPPLIVEFSYRWTFTRIELRRWNRGTCILHCSSSPEHDEPNQDPDDDNPGHAADNAARNSPCIRLVRG